MNPLRKWRETHELSVSRLALLADVGGQIVYGVESGERFRIHPRIVRAIAAVDGPEAAERVVAAYASWREVRSAEVLRELTVAEN
jgi:predicted transcriptional regulator